ncbi:DUF2794 domain-containing protein [Alphaproteobacteria bacterium]|nr:DUF2794 domain-containing protein [Alphaproteobacteria bacterium]
MNLLPSVRKIHNSKLFFSKIELSKILSCYSLGVSKGNWKDYAIIFEKQEASFYMFKHSLASPDCILTKISKNRKKSVIYNLKIQNALKKKYTKIDDILAFLKRRELHII